LTVWSALSHTAFVSEISEERRIADVERRLASKYGHLPPDQIFRTVQKARARFEQSSIREFVPLLVERRASAELSEPRQPATVS
jgi:hypothetical protein